MRLDKFLSNQMPEFSRSEIQRMEITLNNAPTKLGARLRVGDVVSVVIPEISAVVYSVTTTTSARPLLSLSM